MWQPNIYLTITYGRLRQRWAGQWTRNLMGAENLTPLETAAILSRMLDSPEERLLRRQTLRERQRPIEYVRVTIESIQQQLAAFGATPDIQRELGHLFRALGDPDGVYATARTPEAITPTTFEQFVKHKLLPNLH